MLIHVLNMLNESACRGGMECPIPRILYIWYDPNLSYEGSAPISKHLISLNIVNRNGLMLF